MFSLYGVCTVIGSDYIKLNQDTFLHVYCPTNVCTVILIIPNGVFRRTLEIN